MRGECQPVDSAANTFALPLPDSLRPRIISLHSSCGKSQLALQLAVHTALGAPDRPAGSVALMISEGDTQGSIAVRRMLEMAEHITRRRWRKSHANGNGTAHDLGDASSSESSAKRRRLAGSGSGPAASPLEEETVELAKQQVLRNVHLASIRDLDALEHVIEYTLPGLAQRLIEQEAQHRNTGTSQASSSTSAAYPPSPPLRLVIVDNLPCLFYATHPTSMNAMVARSRALGSLSDGLKRIARIGSPLDAMSAKGSVRPKEEPAPTPESASVNSYSTGHSSVDGGSAVVIINHVSDVFERDLRALSEIASFSIPPSSSFASSAMQSSSQVRTAGEPPLAYSHQSPLFSGLTTSVRAVSSLNRMDLLQEEEEEEPAQLVYSGLLGRQVPDLSHLSSVIPSNSFTSALGAAAGEAEMESDPLISGAFPGAKQAALGHVWNNCINARIMLCKTGRRVRKSLEQIEEEEKDRHRGDAASMTTTAAAPDSHLFSSKLRTSTSLFTATLVFAPHAPMRETFFRLGAAGVQSLSVAEVKGSLLPVGYAREEEWADEEEELERKEEEQEQERTGERPTVPTPAGWTDEAEGGEDLGAGMEELEAIMGQFENREA